MRKSLKALLALAIVVGMTVVMTLPVMAGPDALFP